MKKSPFLIIIGLMSIVSFHLVAQSPQMNSLLGVQAGYNYNLQSYDLECCNCECCPTHCPQTSKGYYLGLNYNLPVAFSNFGLHAKLNYHNTSYQSIIDVSGENAKRFIEDVDNPVLRFSQTISTSTFKLDMLASYDFNNLKLYGGFSIGYYSKARINYYSDIISPENAKFPNNSKHMVIHEDKDIDQINKWLTGATIGIDYSFEISNFIVAGPEFFIMFPLNNFLEEYNWKTFYLNFGASIKIKI